MSNSIFGANLKKYRELHGLSQQDLAALLDTTKQVISRYETGQRDPKISTAVEYAQKLNVSLLWMLNLEEPQVDNLDSVITNEISSIVETMTSEQKDSFLSYLRNLKAILRP